MRLAFFGPPGAGKTELAKAMSYIYGGKRLSFADALRTEVSIAYNINNDSLTRVPEKYKYRKLLQDYGSMRRGEDQEYWVNKLHRRIARSSGYLFIDDVRYDNERDMLVDEGFRLVLVRPSIEGFISAISDGERFHASERDWQLWEPHHEIEWVEGPWARARELRSRL